MGLQKKPNFLVVGAAKSGTTSLCGYLKQHPEIFIPERKECRYFSKINKKNQNPFTGAKHADIISKQDEYYKLFEGVDAKALGDISPDYLFYHKESIKNIKKELGTEVKIIIILRNPIERAFSNFLHHVREGEIPSGMKFEDAIEKEDEWEKNDVWWGFLNTKPGYYFESVNSYLREFNNTKVVLFKDYVSDTHSVLREICNFLEVDKKNDFSDPAFKNKTGYPKSKLLEGIIGKKFLLKNLIKKIVQFIIGIDKMDDLLIRIKENNLKKPELDDNTKNVLMEKYYEDIKSLEKIINKDLSFWLK